MGAEFKNGWTPNGMDLTDNKVPSLPSMEDRLPPPPVSPEYLRAAVPNRESVSVADVGRERVQKVADRARSAWNGIRSRAGEASGWVKDKLASAAYSMVGGAEVSAGKAVEGAKAGAEYVADKSVAAAKYTIEKTADAAEYAVDKVVDGVGYGVEKLATGIEYAGRKYEGAKQSVADTRLAAGILASLAGERLSEDWEETKEDAQWVADAAKVLAAMGVVTAGHAASEIAGFMVEQKNRGVDFAKLQADRGARAILEVWKGTVEAKNQIVDKANRAYRGMRERMSAAVGTFNAWRNRTRMLEARVNAQAEQIRRLESLVTMQSVFAEITVVVDEEDDEDVDDEQAVV